MAGAFLATRINHLIDVSGCWLGESEVKRLTHAERPQSGGGPKVTGDLRFMSSGKSEMEENELP